MNTKKEKIVHETGIKGALSGLRQFLANESPWKITRSPLIMDF